ncbi:phosphatase PAP2 family protein [Parasalinivibrio latis]|uniref:phosphatase PAP2 family protein n=1 Tax=Parasalinivibrio latis TaxID=2952610 RepID=UPI0030DE0D81
MAFFNDDYEGLIQMTEGAIYTATATQVLKYTVRAKRPNGVSRHSFPSGHTSAAFQGAAFLHFRYGWEYGLPAYALASSVGASRVDAHKHYWRDVIAGAGLAIGIQYMVTEKGYSISDFILTPYTDGETYGLAGQFKF